MSADVLQEEIEVLESIYPTELTKLSDKDIEITAEPDDPLDGAADLRVTLCVHYTDSYPDELPDLSLKVVEGEISDQDIDELISQLLAAGEENIGMAMTFTLATFLREKLSQLMRSKEEKQKQAEMERERQMLEEEEARTRGTPVTIESFKVWKAKFDKETAQKKAQEEDERLKSMTPKEREEYKRLTSRLSGRHLFERNRNLEEEILVEDGAVSVDITQYDRTQNQEEPEEDIVAFSDSD
ncbi:hypothetical protein AMATHDRAFT_135578 [Amanita thiersii Skay4041]|uniref:RWD domain-containing protein n=1 Tax=Amanita thiersii Skay4041 TaxID=703135 RepID=A0A2A9P151_9AGAR|nr:hypothetical protein AMATHDRAFT_135578 [Amanita thiersii Skay4041]